VASSFMAQESEKAVQQLAQEGIDLELIDLRTVKPIDTDLVFTSLKKTGRLVIADGGWKTCGLAAEIAALVCEAVFEYLKSPIKRVTLPDCPAPASGSLEKAYYPRAEDICQAVRQVLRK
jgi:acetoin:2,6-dichlorophenolindophenol oxidoreductase subunit beta